jgi:MFS family permease
MLYTPSFMAMFIANLCAVSSFSAFFLFPLFIAEHGGSKDDIGIVMGAFALASALCRPWVSEMIDRLGRKRSYTVGCLILTTLPLCYLAFSGQLSEFYFPLLAVRALHGVGLAICFTAVFTYIADIIPANRLNEGIGMFGVSGLVGLAIGPVLAEAVLQRHGFPFYFAVSSGLAGLALLLHLPLPESRARISQQNTPSFFALLGRRKHLTVALLALLFGFGVAATSNFVAPLAQQRHFAVISLFYLAYSAAAVLVRFLGGRLADRVGENRILPYAFLITGAGLFALILVKNEFSFALAGFLSGCGHGLLFPSLNTLAIRNEPSEIRGRVTGIFTGGIDGGAFVGSVVLGYIGEWAGLNALFAVAGGGLLMGLLLFRFRPPAKQ